MDNLKKKSLNLSINQNYVAFQGFCLPLAIVLSDYNLKNWYYLNYMNPIIRLDGMNSLNCTIADGMVYGAGANIYSKIMRISSVNIDICKQIQDIVLILRQHIEKEYYCILFLDFYYLKSSKYYQKEHYTHEILFFGYDDFSLDFKCYGYINGQYKYMKLSYEEVKKAFFSALDYMEYSDGWEEYMLMTLQKVEHKMAYPYNNQEFIDKLNWYVNSSFSADFEYNNLLYLNKTQETVIGVGADVTGVLYKYIELLEEQLSAGTLYDNFVSQLSAINMYEFYHLMMMERLEYFAELNGLKKKLNLCLEQYQLDVVQKIKIIRMLYLKLVRQIEKNISVVETLTEILNKLEQIVVHEKNILENYSKVICE